MLYVAVISHDVTCPFVSSSHIMLSLLLYSLVVTLTSTWDSTINISAMLVTNKHQVINPGHLYLLHSELRESNQMVAPRGRMNLVMKKRRGTGTTQIFFYYTLRLLHRILGDVVKPTKGEERASPEDDDEDAEDRLHRKSEEMWWSHRRRRDISTGVDHKMGKNVPALKIDGENAGQ